MRTGSRRFKYQRHRIQQPLNSYKSHGRLPVSILLNRNHFLKKRFHAWVRAINDEIDRRTKTVLVNLLFCQLIDFQSDAKSYRSGAVQRFKASLVGFFPKICYGIRRGIHASDKANNGSDTSGCGN